MVQIKPQEVYVPETQIGVRYHIWRLVTSPPFENFIMLLIILNTLLLMCKVYYTQLYFYVLDFKSNDDLLSFRSWRHISFWQFTFSIYKPFVRLRNRKAKELLIANSIHSLSQYIATDYLGSKTYQTNAIWKIKFLPSYSFKALHWNSLTSLRI